MEFITDWREVVIISGLVVKVLGGAEIVETAGVSTYKTV